MLMPSYPLMASASNASCIYYSDCHCTNRFCLMAQGLDIESLPAPFWCYYLLLGPDTPASKYQLDPSNYSTPSTQQAIQALYYPNRFNNIRHIADLKWKSNKNNNTWFTDSYKATLPSQWARQILSCGIAKALSSHVDNAFSILRSHHHQSSHISPTQFSRYSSDSL